MAAFSQWILPSFVALSVALALTRRLDIFRLFIEGAEEGLRLVVQIFPYILGMYVAIGIFQAGGALSLLTQALSPLLAPLRFPPELLPLAIIRPLSGAAALGYLVQVLERFGPDSFTGRLASVMQGSSETTFYVLSIYLGSVGIRRAGAALFFCLLGDTAGLLSALWVSRWVWGG